MRLPTLTSRPTQWSETAIRAVSSHVRPRSPQSRFLHTTFHSLPGSTPESLKKYLDSHPLPSPPSSSISSSSLPVTAFFIHPDLENIKDHLDLILGHRPRSIGSFALSSSDLPQTRPGIHIATFTPEIEKGESIRLFASRLLGRKEAEVGKWQRTAFVREIGNIKPVKTQIYGDNKTTRRTSSRAESPSPSSSSVGKGSQIGDFERILGLDSSSSVKSTGDNSIGGQQTEFSWDNLWKSDHDHLHDHEQAAEHYRDCEQGKMTHFDPDSNSNSDSTFEALPGLFTLSDTSSSSSSPLSSSSSSQSSSPTPPNPISSFLILSDSAPSKLISHLDRLFPSASKLGFIAAPTPFVNGRPYTLFLQNEVEVEGECEGERRPRTTASQVFSDGAVGIAFEGVDPAVVQTGVNWIGLEPLSAVVEVADAQGNMLLGLSTSYREGNSTSTSTSTSNPTQALILAIEAFRHSERLRTKVDPASAPKNAQTAALGIKAGKTLKEEEYYLALLGSSSSGHSGKGEWTETIQQVVKIVSGDPSRGAMSLEMEQPLRVGQKVQFMHRPSATASTSSTPTPSSPCGLSFEVLQPQDDFVHSSSHSSSTSTEQVVTDHVYLGTEGGFFHSPGFSTATSKTRKQEDSVNTEVCKVIGAVGWFGKQQHQ